MRGERRHCFGVHLVAGKLEHFILVAHGVAARAHFIVAIGILGEWRAGTPSRTMWPASVRARLIAALLSARSKSGGARSRRDSSGYRHWRHSRPGGAGAPDAPAFACAASTRSECRKSALPLPHYWADFAEIMVNARLKYGFGLILPLNRRLPCECSIQSP